MAKDKDGLTPQQLMFCKQYVVDLNATQAAIRAGYKEKTAVVQASKLLIHPNVMQKIQKLMDVRSDKIMMKAEDVLLQLKNLASVDITKAFNKDGMAINIHDMPEEIRQAIHTIDFHEDGKIKRLKFYDKTRALELIGKHLKLFTEQIEVGGQLNVMTLADMLDAIHCDYEDVTGQKVITNE